MKHILIVDDDRVLAPMLAEYLESRGLRVSLAQSGDAGLAAFQSQIFDLCILDVKMPIKDGFTLAAEIRQINPLIPFIFLSGQNQKEDRIRGLMLGADDYVTKPFSMEEVFLRVEIVLRRAKTSEKVEKTVVRHEIGKYQFDPISRTLLFENEIAEKLSGIETKLLELFCQSENGIVERETALRRVWGDDEMFHSRSLNVYVSKLRGYLKNDPRIEFLNIHGEGYRLVIG